MRISSLHAGEEMPISPKPLSPRWLLIFYLDPSVVPSRPQLSAMETHAHTHTPHTTAIKLAYCYRPDCDLFPSHFLAVDVTRRKGLQHLICGISMARRESGGSSGGGGASVGYLDIYNAVPPVQTPIKKNHECEMGLKHFLSSRG